MSAINETKPKAKRGRPKKVKEEIPVVPQVTNDETTKLATKAVEEIMSQAAGKSSVELESPVSIEGAKTTASSHDNLKYAQKDYIPGTRIHDLQQVPSHAYDEDLQRTRQVGLPSDYHYCWVHTDKITQFRIEGYRFVQYNGGPGSGLAAGGFSGTGMFEKTFDNHVRNGDMLLMWCDMRRFEEIQSDDFKRRQAFESSVESEVHNDGYRRGVRTFVEKDGVTLYN